MSAMVLRDTARLAIEKQISEHAGYLAERTGDTPDQMRLNQGVVKGLKLALDALNDSYKAMHG